MRGAGAVYLREVLLLRRRFWRQLASMSVAPLLYLVAFGYGMGADRMVQGVPYTVFLLPGLIALNSMTHAYGIASEINIARFYHRMFEEFQAAPITSAGIVAGEVLAGMTRAMLSAVVIAAMALLFGIDIHINLWLGLAVLLNAFVFASLAVSLAMLVKSHQDQSLLSTFVITPMAFLGGTFFPLDNMPPLIRDALSLLPVAHAAKAIRRAALGQPPEWTPYLVLTVLGVLFFGLACLCVRKAKA